VRAVTTTEQRTDEQVDLWDPGLFRNGPPLEIFDRLRVEAPLHWSPRADDPDGGFWSLTRHADVQALSRDYARFTNKLGTGVPRYSAGEMAHWGDNIMYRDPPDHTAHRKPVNRLLSPKAVNELAGMVRSVVVGLLDGLEGRDRFDWVPEVAAEIPARVVAFFIGIPQEDHGNIVTWASNVFGNDGTPEATARWQDAIQAIMAYGANLVSTRRAQPSDDVMTILLSTQVDGQPLTDDVLLNWFLALNQAGFETTHTLIAQGMVLLDEFPDLRERLAADRAAIGPAVEEMLRYITPVNFMARTATQDVELHGRTIRHGQYVCLWYSAANRDPEVFVDPHRFVVDRSPNPHQSFGAAGAPHYCIGAYLARLEMRILLEELADRGFPFRLDGPPERAPGVWINALKHLPVTRT
jgi:cytochrome P450